jgi:hypothetical protein
MAQSKVTMDLLLIASLLTTGLIPVGIAAADYPYTDIASKVFQPVSLLLKADDPANNLLETALQVSAEDLAEGYLWAAQLLDWLPAVASGLTIQTPDMLINSDNLDEVEADLSSRLEIYEIAINRRGYESIAGFYEATATTSCGQTKVSWTTSIAAGEAGEISIVQNGFRFQIVHRFEGTEPFEVEIPGVIVESKMTFNDPMNGDFGFIGTVAPDQITVNPDTARNLAAWPDWANPPSQADLDACVVTLRPVEGSP